MAVERDPDRPTLSSAAGATVESAAVGARLLVILGPTASGKSALAMEVARRTGAELLSVDSMQVYRGMDIGAAKPTPAERREIVHHLVDVADPNESFTVARFVDLADAAIASAAARTAPLIVTGGTPLYYKALFEGLFDGPGADPTIRERLAGEQSDVLARRLALADPTAAERIHPNDRRRIVRALEVYELTGKPISSFQTHWTAPAPRHPAVWVGLQWDRDALNRRINARVRSMLEAGWPDEVKGLLDRYGVLSKTAAEATGYEDLIAVARGTLPLDEAAEHIKIATRQLARRQMKWFRRFPRVDWLDGSRELSSNADEAIALWRAAPPADEADTT